MAVHKKLGTEEKNINNLNTNELANADSLGEHNQKINKGQKLNYEKISSAPPLGQVINNKWRIEDMLKQAPDEHTLNSEKISNAPPLSQVKWDNINMPAKSSSPNQGSSILKRIWKGLLGAGWKSTQARSEVAFDPTFVIDKSIRATNSDQFNHKKSLDDFEVAENALEKSAANTNINENDRPDIKFESAPELNNVDPEMQSGSNSNDSSLGSSIENKATSNSEQDSVETSNKQSKDEIEVNPEVNPKANSPSNVRELVAFYDKKSEPESGSSSSMSPS